MQLGLSKEQHELMLVYRAHPQIENLIRRLESGELKARELTLSEMEKELKTAGNGWSVFQRSEVTSHAAKANAPDDQNTVKKHLKHD